MIRLQDRSYAPALNEISAYVQNPVFQQFCSDIKETYNCKEKIEYSSCSMAPGWNIKFKKSGKSLCTIYPHISYFTVLVVVGAKEKEAVNALLPDCGAELQQIYEQTKEGNGQKWLMVNLTDQDSMYRDTLRLIKIRSNR